LPGAGGCRDRVTAAYYSRAGPKPCSRRALRNRRTVEIVGGVIQRYVSPKRVCKLAQAQARGRQRAGGQLAGIQRGKVAAVAGGRRANVASLEISRAGARLVRESRAQIGAVRRGKLCQDAGAQGLRRRDVADRADEYLTGWQRQASAQHSKPIRDEITLVIDHGVEGDAHAGRFIQHRYLAKTTPLRLNDRQIHLMASELFAELATNGFNIAPGQLGENVITAGLDLTRFPLGTCLRIGSSAIVELTGLRTPCVLIED
jgi:hypothetical protein